MSSKIKNLRPEIIQQLLFVKSLLSQAQFLPEVNPSSFSIAKKILIAHDVAEMGIAAIADQIGALPYPNDKRYLMDYFDPIKKKKHSSHDVEGKEYFRQLNIVRGNLKHGMILPDRYQWINVQDKVYDYLSKWCQTYLKTSLGDLDSAILICNAKVKTHYDNAKRELSSGNYQHVLESLAKAAYLLFEENRALRSLQVGVSRAEDAIKLAAFGVQSNDFLALQEFLPQVSQKSDEDILIQWKQKGFGHPGNWRKDSAEFCMSTFLDLALKIQNAEWIPGPISFLFVYEHKIEAIKDNVEITREDWESSPLTIVPPRSKVIKVLKKGESIRGMVNRELKSSLGLLGADWLGQTRDKKPEKISIISEELPGYTAYVVLDDVKVTCIPKEDDLVKEYFPNLPTIDMQLD